MRFLAHSGRGINVGRRRHPATYYRSGIGVMILDDPLDFDLVLTGGAYSLLQDSAPAKFRVPASKRGIAKLYTIASGRSLVYVGIAQQPMSARLSFGFRANGKSGYWGYKWKDLQGKFSLSVWTAQVDDIYVPLRELETVEAEVAYLCRHESGQWPSHQHEIHFYPSGDAHREAASRIYSHAVRDRE